MSGNQTCSITEQTDGSKTHKRNSQVSDRRNNRVFDSLASNQPEQPLIGCIIAGKQFQLYIEETYSIHKENKSGVLLRIPSNGTKFFCPFDRITFTS